MKKNSFANLMAFSVACIGGLFALFAAPRVVLQLYRLAHPGVEPMTLFEEVLVFPTLQIGLIFGILGAATGAGFVLSGTERKLTAFLLFLVPSLAALLWLSTFPDWGAITTVPEYIPVDYPRPDYRHFATSWCYLMLGASALVLFWYIVQRLLSRGSEPIATADSPAPTESLPDPPAETSPSE